MRVKLSIPARVPLITVPYRISISDINYGNHLGNDRLLTLAHEARLQLFSRYGMNEMSFFGKSLIMADAMVQYKNQGLYGDELEISVWMDNIGPLNFDLLYLVTKVSDTKKTIFEKPIEISRIKTGMVFFDYEKQKMAKASEEFLKTFASDT